MLNSEKEFLSYFGWDDFFENQILETSADSLCRARVICEERNLFRVQLSLDQAIWATVSGKMHFNAKTRVDCPAVGDWVLVEVSPQSDRGVIQQVLSRKTTIYRKQVSTSADLQILSANVDYAFITTSVQADLNFRRMERYLTLALDAGATPVILLTKADTCLQNIEDVIVAVQKEFPNVPVHTLTQNNFEKTDFLASYLKKGTTSVFIGSSGVGKSTLVNFLIGKQQIKTQEVRDDDGKGRHTTTSRNLYVSYLGGLIIDTPGMRELQLSDHSEGVQEQFSDIEELFLKCRFSDCKHQSEPDCAIQEALKVNYISLQRWQSYQKLEAEAQSGQLKKNKALITEEKKKWKKISIAARDKNRSKREDF